MKKKVVILLAGLLTVLSMGFGAAQFSDMPAGHWATEAVEQLAAKGVLVGYPDGTFRGTETLTRYQAALILQRLLEEIEVELSATKDILGKGGAAAGAAAQTDPALQAQIDSLKAQVAALEASDASTRVDIEALMSEIARLSEMAAAPSAAEAVMGDAELMETVRNAVQELASEMAALGVRVSALEDNSASKDDVAALQASLADLSAKMTEMANAEPAMDMSALQDLADRVEAASVAADTALAQTQQLSENVDAALAQVAAVAERVDGVEGEAAAAKTQLEADGDSIRALNELAVLLNQDVLTLQDRATSTEKALGDMAAKADLEDLASMEDVAAVQEFTIALRGDLVKLADRVATLETSVATLQRNAFTISGSLSLSYRVNRAWSTSAGTPETFDIDRLYSSSLSSGDANANGQVVDEADLGTNSEGKTSASLAVTFKGGSFSGSSQPGNLNSYPNMVSFSLKGSWADASVAAGTAGTSSLTVDSVSTTLGVAANQQVAFTFGRTVRAKFTEYVFDNDAVSRGHGFVATLKPGILGATVTGVYGSTGADNADFNYFSGARVAADLGVAKVGVSYASEGKDENQGGNVPVASTPTTVLGVDASTALGPVNLAGEYFTSTAAADANGFYVRAGADLGIVNLSGNYRSIGAGATSANMLSGDTGSNNAAPYVAGQTGFGISAKSTLGPVALTGFFNSYAAGANANQAFGVTASTTFGPLKLDASFGQASSNGTAADSVAGEAPGSSYTSNLGVTATVSGLLPNVTLIGSYTSRPVAGSTTIVARADIGNTSLGFADVSALVRYSMVDAATDSSTLKFGGKLSTGALAALLPGTTVAADFAMRNTTSATNTSEMKWSVGAKLAQFVLPNSAFEIKYGSYTASNVASVLLGASDASFSSASDAIASGAGAASGSVTGMFYTWTYWDLTFSFGSFDVTNGANKTHGETFRIGYRVNF
jgi:hypothetical protein